MSPIAINPDPFRNIIISRSLIYGVENLIFIGMIFALSALLITALYKLWSHFNPKEKEKRDAYVLATGFAPYLAMLAVFSFTTAHASDLAWYSARLTFHWFSICIIAYAMMHLINKLRPQKAKTVYRAILIALACYILFGAWYILS